MAPSPENEAKKPVTGMRIKVTDNGPYEVYGGVPLLEMALIPDDDGLSSGWQTGKTYPAADYYELCRCGQSKNKPFCDLSHQRVHFQGSETATRGPLLDLAEPPVIGPLMDLIDIPKICASARFCDRSGGVWDRTRQSDDPESQRIALEIVANCPAGRLILRNKQGQDLEPELEPSIALVEDPSIGGVGPLWVRGGIPIESADGHVYEVRNRVTLCRCGQSGNKPFCDGRHTEA